MTLLERFLCYVGYHKWRWVQPPGVDQSRETCVRCGKLGSERRHLSRWWVVAVLLLLTVAVAAGVAADASGATCDYSAPITSFTGGHAWTEGSAPFMTAGIVLGATLFALAAAVASGGPVIGAAYFIVCWLIAAPALLFLGIWAGPACDKRCATCVTSPTVSAGSLRRPGSTGVEMQTLIAATTGYPL